MRITRNGKVMAASVDDRIYAAGEESEEEFSDDELLEDDDALNDTLDGIADDIEDMQDNIEEVTEDDVSIETDNNIEGHYIAECDRCYGIFISAVSESDQVVESIKGICPLCDKESEQYLKWVIKPVD